VNACLKAAQDAAAHKRGAITIINNERPETERRPPEILSPTDPRGMS
jgi:hypothetical protein